MDNYTCVDYVTPKDLQFRTPTNEELKSNNAIIGVVTGTHFVPEGLSRNKRWYPKELWLEQLEKPHLREKLENKTMVGTIGHDLEIKEEQFRNGLVSHFTTGLKVEPTGDPRMPYRGYAESYILNTPAGNLLKTYLEAGMNLSVSSRADGDFLPGITHRVEEDGSEVPILDKDKYRLERFDWVLQPGFLQARPQLKEELGLTEEVVKTLNESYEKFEKTISENNICESTIKESTNMGTTNTNDLVKKSAGDLVIKVTADNELEFSKAKGTSNTAKYTEAPHTKAATADDTTDVKGAGETTFPHGKGDTLVHVVEDEGSDLTEGLLANALTQITELRAENESLQKALAEAVASDAKPDVNDLTRKMLDGQKPKMDKSGNVGDYGEVVADLKKSNIAEGEEGEEGGADEIAEILEDFFDEAGDPDSIITALQETSEFHEEVGTPSEIVETLSTTQEFFEDVGTPKEIVEALDAQVEFFENVGNPNEILAMAEFVEEFFGKYGSPEKVAHVLDSTRAFFEEVGSPEEIKESIAALAQLNTILEEYKSLGLTNITEMKAMLEDLQQTKFENYARAIAEHTGLNSTKVMEYLGRGMTEEEIVRLHNESSDSFHERYMTVREDLNSVPLKTVDPDGNNVQLRNVTYKNDMEESQTTLSRVLSKITA